MLEYSIVLVFLTMVICITLIGIPGDLEGDGGRDGNPDTPDDPTVISILNDSQHQFVRDIYQP